MKKYHACNYYIGPYSQMKKLQATKEEEAGMYTLIKLCICASLWRDFEETLEAKEKQVNWCV